MLFYYYTQIFVVISTTTNIHTSREINVQNKPYKFRIYKEVSYVLDIFPILPQAMVPLDFDFSSFPSHPLNPPISFPLFRGICFFPFKFHLIPLYDHMLNK